MALPLVLEVEELEVPGLVEVQDQSQAATQRTSTHHNHLHRVSTIPTE
jgi:hypothetical protein